MKQRQPGYIFMIALMMLAVFTFLVTYLATQSDAFVHYARSSIDHQKARSLAMAGIHLGMSQLADGMRSTSDADEKIDTEQKLAKRLLRTLLPVYGNFQTYVLKQGVEGISGTIGFCISCEESKIDLNALYDRKKNTFIGEGQQSLDYKKIMQNFFERLSSLMPAKDLFTEYVTYMQHHPTIINDVTELLMIKAFGPFGDAIFYEPSSDISTKDGHKSQHTLYLQDLFTVWSHKRMLEPWLLTDSICSVLGLTRSMKKENENNVPQDFPDTFVWEKDWDKYLAPVYGKKYMDLPEFIRPLLAPKFEPKIFSVLSYGKIGRVTQKVLAIVELHVVTTQKKQKRYDASIRTIYWL